MRWHVIVRRVVHLQLASRRSSSVGLSSTASIIIPRQQRLCKDLKIYDLARGLKVCNEKTPAGGGWGA